MNILHITDLHINNPNGTDEALRCAFYPEYFESLIKQINTNNEVVDYIFVTGDIVNQANTGNYSHAFDVLKHLSSQLNVSLENIFVTNGNHDVHRDTGILSEFRDFSNKFNSGSAAPEKGDRFELYIIAKKDAVLCLDSIGTSHNTGYSSPLDPTNKDDIIRSVRGLDINNLFILSHHPAESYSIQNSAPFDEENTKWPEQHLWPDGGNLYKRLSSPATIKGKCFWFSGDVHRSDYSIIEGIRVLSVVSSLNLTATSESKIPPQVRIVSVDNIDTSLIYSYTLTGHNGTGLDGVWESKKEDAFQVGSNPLPKQPQSLSVQTKEIENSASILEAKISLISIDLEQDIHKKIIDKKLYEFGRFDTNRDLTSLSWVSVQGLLEDYSIFSKIIEAFKGKIDELTSRGIDLENCLLVGVDSWGAILSSRLGTATNIRNCCVAVRNQRESYDSVELANKPLQNIVQGKEFIFVISDVISTGRSISTVYKELKGVSSSNWYNFVIICDPTQNREGCFENYLETYNLCGSIKMPIVKKDKLPSLDMLDANISFLK